MSKDIIGKKTRHEFREHFVGWTLREIREEFDSADILADEDYASPLPGQRRSLVDQYYHGVDWSKWEDVRKVLAVFRNVLVQLEMSSKNTESQYSDYARKTFTSLTKWLKLDGFEYEDGKLEAIGRGRQLEALSTTTAKLDTPEIQRQIERLYGSIEDDPALAIGTAKELVETACKTILTERNKKVETSWDLGELVKAARKALGLLPEGVSDAAKGADTVRKLLGSLGNIAQGLGELRNLYGTGHGKHGKAKGLSQRHARLAVGAASTLVIFLFETHIEK